MTQRLLKQRGFFDGVYGSKLCFLQQSNNALAVNTQPWF